MPGSFPIKYYDLLFPILPFLALLIIGSFLKLLIFRNRSIIVKHLLSAYDVRDQVLVIGGIGLKKRGICVPLWGLQLVNRNNNHVLMSEQAVLYSENLTCIVIFYSLSGRYCYHHLVLEETEM